MRNKFVVLGGAGTIGRVVARDLFESDQRNQIIVADYNFEKAKGIAARFKESRVEARFADAREPKNLARLLREGQVVINCLQHDFNMRVMEAALVARVNYLDLGGLFHWTQQQLKLNKEFRKAGLVAVIGMGCAPGITNILAAHLAKDLDKIRSIKIRVGSRNFKPVDTFSFPYSPQTIIEELTLEPYVWSQGAFETRPPRVDWECTKFPKPVGTLSTLLTRHSEVATLPLSLSKKGVQYCDFMVGFERRFVSMVSGYLEDNWKLKQFAKFATPTPRHPDDYEISRVTVDDWVADCHAKSKPEWRASAGDVDTGCPPSIVAQMIVAGQIDRSGVHPPELVVPFDDFFTELVKRGMKIEVHRRA